MIRINFKPEHFTEAFPPHIKPKRPGWYLVSRTSESSCLPQVGVPAYAHYDGREWGWTCSDPNFNIETHGPGANQIKWWMGLNFDPNALHL